MHQHSVILCKFRNIKALISKTLADLYTSWCRGTSVFWNLFASIARSTILSSSDPSRSWQQRAQVDWFGCYVKIISSPGSRSLRPKNSRLRLPNAEKDSSSQSFVSISFHSIGLRRSQPVPQQSCSSLKSRRWWDPFRTSRAESVVGNNTCHASEEGSCLIVHLPARSQSLNWMGKWPEETSHDPFVFFDVFDSHGDMAALPKNRSWKGSSVSRMIIFHEPDGFPKQIWIRLTPTSNALGVKQPMNFLIQLTMLTWLAQRPWI